MLTATWVQHPLRANSIKAASRPNRQGVHLAVAFILRSRELVPYLSRLEREGDARDGSAKDEIATLEAAPLHWFANWPVRAVPAAGSILAIIVAKAGAHGSYGRSLPKGTGRLYRLRFLSSIQV